jgi:hypothetical protein
MNVIEKNNEHYTDCDVVMLSSLTETIKNDIVVWNGLKIWDGKGEIPHHNQQLHFLSNDTPTAGDSQWLLFCQLRVIGCPSFGIIFNNLNNK